MVSDAEVSVGVEVDTDDCQIGCESRCRNHVLVQLNEIRATVLANGKRQGLRRDRSMRC